MSLHNGKSDHNKGTSLAEAINLASSANLNILHSKSLKLKKINPRLFFGSGLLGELKAISSKLKVKLLYINSNISPTQQKNIENFMKLKVVDRTGLILEIFSLRARSKQGKVQVELAQLEYYKSRLVKSWTHLERQRGGMTFIGGPGETQIEIDRRLISTRISKLKKELKKINSRYLLQRNTRKKTENSNIVLVGYTNTGKSTLFNSMTKSEIYADNKLFATLDPISRKLILSNDKSIVITDTVGFISNLPTELIEPFKATLSEIINADLILHVHDISNKNWKIQKDKVIEILQQIGADTHSPGKILDIYNKIDLLDDMEIEELTNKYTESKSMVAVSAMKKISLDLLLNKIVRFFDKQTKTVNLKLKYTENDKIAWLYRNTSVLENNNINKKYLNLKVRINKISHQKYLKYFN